ncbi:Uncharacterized protein NEOC65_001227 [Neochlamydia sp. AcF65]|uniref:nucleotidyl transferase AbiEii/AbiGii toxin family protein n=1 Tax=Neochlamydia sp. AcF65 TaxID=2795735 RepID=UPI001BC936EC|nr:nucleotidyl transferase AbiEii/AbiGii toxin family protein [Neochlamydia sp. AcF65]MBS4166147.1 Uncharacterized protein [Neochlamydia sp. AcF65]
MNEQALKDRLQVISIEKGIHFNECWKKLLLERFLVRLSHSTYAPNFIFKGGSLLAYFLHIGRETTDLDFLLTNMKAGQEEAKQAIEQIAAIELKDGFSFKYAGIDILEQPHMDYSGYRVHLKATFGRMQDKIHIDVGIGDIVKPFSQDIYLFQYKGHPLFEEEVSLMVYPPETIFAEKLETVISKGTANSRMKDYHDLLLLIRDAKLINFKILKDAITNTFKNRKRRLELLSFDEADLESLQKLWAAHLKNLGNIARELNLPKEMHSTIKEINAYIKQLGLT